MGRGRLCLWLQCRSGLLGFDGEAVGGLFARGFSGQALAIGLVCGPGPLLALKVAERGLVAAATAQGRSSSPAGEAGLRAGRRGRPVLVGADGNVVALGRMLGRQLGDLDGQNAVFEGAFDAGCQVAVFGQAQRAGEVTGRAFQHAVGARSHQRRHSLGASLQVLVLREGQLRVAHTRDGQRSSLHVQLHLVLLHPGQVCVNFPASGSFQHVHTGRPLVGPRARLVVGLADGGTRHPVAAEATVDVWLLVLQLLLFLLFDRVVCHHHVVAIVVFVLGG